MRPVTFQRGFLAKPAGSCLVCFGRTRVLCSVSIEREIPPHRRGSGGGWLTAEYAMLPGSTAPRKRRDGPKQDGRSVEIQRLVGRALRAAVDLDKIGEVTLAIDCDVLDADGGTRTAAITGAWVALHDALGELATQQKKPGPGHYLTGQIAAVSVGLVDGKVETDLDYVKDVKAEVDMNVVMRCPVGGGQSDFVEVQGTGEHGVFSRVQLDQLLAAAGQGCDELFRAQRSALG
jgi:ribonuclease PH